MTPPSAFVTHQPHPQVGRDVRRRGHRRVPRQRRRQLPHWRRDRHRRRYVHHHAL